MAEKASSLRQQMAPAGRGVLRFVSAASLFDGHDAAINMIRRLLQASGAEVVHLGHNRSVSDIVRAAIQEDADGIAVSSYQGGHNEYFKYMVDMLKEQGCEHIRVVVGGGGTIAPDEIEMLEKYGVEKIYTPEDGRRMGLVPMIEDVMKRVRAARKPHYEFGPLNVRDHRRIATSITILEGADGEVKPRRSRIRSVVRSRASSIRRRWLALPARAAQASRVSATSCWRASCGISPIGRSPSSLSTRRVVAPAARCSAIASA
jgi:methylmalonyl-CoA mutase cobalamin-binding domain/chain